MSMLGPYASWNKEVGYAVWDNPTAEHVGIFERLNIQPKGIIAVGLWDFLEYGCYTKLVGNKIIGVEANPHVYESMSKPVCDKWGMKCFNEFIYREDNVIKDFYFADYGSSFYPGQPEWNKVQSIKVKTKTLSTLIEENNIDMNEYDFLNIDVEGAELDALIGFEKYLDYINIIDLETTLDDRHKSGISHDIIVEWLDKRGFELKEMSASYANEGWGDSIFVRRNKNLNPFVNKNFGEEVFGKNFFENDWPKYLECRAKNDWSVYNEN